MAEQIKYNYLLNFSASYVGGGLKRLQEYAKWFNGNGGAWFVIHPQCKRLVNKYPKNKYFVVRQSRFKRVFNDCEYLQGIYDEVGQPDLYYSYGIPIYSRFGKLNWFHLSNVLPLYSKGMPLALFDKYVRLKLLGWKIKKNYLNADYISAESQNSLNYIEVADKSRLHISVNGSNDELLHLKSKEEATKEKIAVILGTHKYKALLDSYEVFKFISKEEPGLRLIVIGGKETVPEILTLDSNVQLTGILPRNEVITCLKKSKYYISTTMIENSYNAASEGIVFADESFISDIGPHKELLSKEKFKAVSIPNLGRPLLHVKRSELIGCNMRSWDEIINDMNSIVQKALYNT